MEQITMDQILEHLKAAMMAELKAMTEANRVKMEAKMVAWLRQMKAMPEACEEKAEAFLKKKSAPEPREFVPKSQEIPKGATKEETIGAAKDRSRNLHLAVGCRGQLKTQTKNHDGSRQESAAVGRPIRRTVPATRRGGLRTGAGKKCRSGTVRSPGRASVICERNCFSVSLS
jgi:hypothetical protein